VNKSGGENGGENEIRWMQESGWQWSHMKVTLKLVY